MTRLDRISILISIFALIVGSMVSVGWWVVSVESRLSIIEATIESRLDTIDHHINETRTLILDKLQ